VSVRKSATTMQFTNEDEHFIKSLQVSDKYGRKQFHEMLPAIG